MTTLWEDDPSTDDSARLLPIGAVAEQLRAEFPGISISKIRYLEDQKLISPTRTAGGYRLFGASDVERLRTILTLQRDEFLPLRVIRQELDSASASIGFSAVNHARQMKRAQLGEPPPARRYSGDEIRAKTGAEAGTLRDLESYGLISGGASGYDEADIDVVRTALELAAFGVEARHLRLFRVAADREAGLFEQVLAAGLRSRSPERRRQAVAELESLAALAAHLRHLLLVSVLRKLVSQ